MAKATLFLLKPGFHDDKGGPFFCPDCAAVEGFLKYAPQIEGKLDVRRIEFPRPSFDKSVPARCRSGRTCPPAAGL